jgi:hypothetical protein
MIERKDLKAKRKIEKEEKIGGKWRQVEDVWMN